MSELRATYRLQLGPPLDFAGVLALVGYLRDLGVSHLYLSPCFQARPGSPHGYDVVDPTRLSTELGGEDGFRKLARGARSAGLGLVLDIVPNHMAADDANPYWRDERRRARFFDWDAHSGRHRRFFDVDALAGVRQEDPAVFAETQRLALSLVREGLVDGLRVDHPDGLADPAGYLAALRAAGARRVWVEKVLQAGERLRDWPVEGTVGYEFLNDVTALFIDPAGEPVLDALWLETSHDARAFAQVAREAKREQVLTTFRPEVDWLARSLAGPLPGGREALEDALASLPVYRTYVEPAARRVDEDDRRALERGAVHPELARILLLEDPAPDAFATRFQQTTPAVMAKGVEDTAFYRHARLLALNEVGGDPGRFGLSVAAFHAANLQRAARFPRNLLPTQTHDTKRSGDVRARIGALASLAERWAVHVRHWENVAAPLAEPSGPSRVERYFLYQTLIGTWPLEPERLDAYLVKALREAKRTTSWLAPDHEHEQRARAFCRRLCQHAPFLEDFVPFAREVARAGERVALGQLALKLTVPGVPDIYQGDELETLALVDPDNRRPVDWGRRQQLLAEILDGAAPWPATRKLWLTHRLLALRAARPQPFRGSYEPLDAGEGACAFLRGGELLVIVVVRTGVARAAVHAPAGRWQDVLGGGWHELGGVTPLDDLVDAHGIAVLARAR